jgi:serine/threonine protein kinase
MIEIPGYRVEREFGEGGMATVYLAIQESLDRPVAMKVLSAELVSDEEFCKRFLREGKTLASLSHPHVVKIFDSGEHDGIFYMIMELMSGGTLNDRLNSGNLPPVESVEIVKKVASALAFSHGKGLIHRDVKPANVLFSEEGTPVLSDFGIVKATKKETTQMTALGMAIGTPSYMSPEQASALELTPRTDQYSLGVMLFEMLTGRVPFEADTAAVVVGMHIHADIPELPAAVKHFQPIVDRMMAKAPDQRFDTMDELAMELDNAAPANTEYFEAAKSPVSSLPMPVLLLAGGGVAALLVAALAYLFLEAGPDQSTGDPVVIVPSPTTTSEPGVPTRPLDPEVVKWLDIAQAHYDIGRLFEPPGNNALEAYWKVFEFDATNPDALNGTRNIAALLAPMARESLEKGDVDESRLLMEKGLLADPKNKNLVELQKALNDL